MRKETAIGFRAAAQAGQARTRAAIVAGLLLVTLACYGQVVGFDFVNLDDGVYASENPQVKAGLTKEGLYWAFSTTAGANWHPVTWLSLMADSSLFGPTPGGYHLTNLLLHLANTLLLFFLFQGLTGRIWASAFVAALFAVHPLHVESVAWISERKDVLSTFFGLSSLIFYGRFARSGRRVDYWCCFVALVLGLLSKPMLVTWPFVFLLLDFWPLGRLEAFRTAPQLSGGRTAALFAEKIPFFLPAALVCWTTLAAQKQQGAMDLFETLPLAARAANAAVAYAAYLYKTAFPLNLSVFYPHPGVRIAWAAAAAATVFLAGVTVFALKTARRRPYIAFGWFWFLGTLVPVIGVVQVGSQAMADRYTYIPLIGLFVALSWGAADIAKAFARGRLVLAAAAAVVLAVLGAAAHEQASYWKNSLTLFGRVLKIAPENDLAHNNYGTALERAGRYQEAKEHYRRAVSLNHRNASAHNNLANRLAAEGRLDAAVGLYRRAVELSPDEPAFHYNLGVALARRGDGKGAIAAFAGALAIDPQFARAYQKTGVLLLGQGRRSAAQRFFEAARKLEAEDGAAPQPQPRRSEGGLRQ